MASSTAARTHDPIHRVWMSFEREGDDRLWVSTWLDDGGHLPEHFHPTLEARWEVVDGTARLKVDGTWRPLVLRSSCLIPGASCAIRAAARCGSVPRSSPPDDSRIS